MTTLQAQGLAYRKARVGVLFAPEWNQDTEAFKSWGSPARWICTLTSSGAVAASTATSASALQPKNVGSVMCCGSKTL